MAQSVVQDFTSLEQGFENLRLLIGERLILLVSQEDFSFNPPIRHVPEYQNEAFCRMIAQYDLSFEEKMVVVIALAPYIHPILLDVFTTTELKVTIHAGSIGGFQKEPSRAFIPTIRTVLFLLGSQGKPMHEMFSQEEVLVKENIISIERITSIIPIIDSPIFLSEEYYCLLTTGKFEPRQDENFPAKKITTSQNWEDLVIRQEVLEQIIEINDWIAFSEAIMNQGSIPNKIKKGYRALFYGSSGTGKTMTASLLGKSFRMPVYRIDLSMVVSKYIGETEKNLEKIFTMAESRGWVLFFDEAEALFGKRGATNDAHDRYANQEISYLLQRIEDFDGVIILATNKYHDLDDAFKRRFQAMIEFPDPNAQERLLLWNKTFEGCGFEYAEDLDFETLATNKEATGGMLINVLRHAAIKVIKAGDNILRQEYLISGLKKEYNKENKMWIDVPSVLRRAPIALNAYAKQNGLLK
ncbi:MAG: ATP-binding protein [Cytophagaceae bacterium]|jgi:AAA+ superfamily predicted ATPase|nr:ATP-binding protein [Cytophagaceae bacterium]